MRRILLESRGAVLLEFARSSPCALAESILNEPVLYRAADIEVLSGLEPVRRRPGMYTDTSRPNHLAHEVIDNSVDEALAGHCKQIDVTLLQGRLAARSPTTAAACRSTSTRRRR